MGSNQKRFVRSAIAAATPSYTYGISAVGSSPRDLTFIESRCKLRHCVAIHPSILHYFHHMCGKHLRFLLVSNHVQNLSEIRSAERFIFTQRTRLECKLLQIINPMTRGSTGFPDVWLVMWMASGYFVLYILSPGMMSLIRPITPLYTSFCSRLLS